LIALDAASGHPGPPRSLVARPGIGACAHVLQQRSLEIVRLQVERPALILVRRGVKTVTCGNALQVRAQPGQAVALAGGQTVDFCNHVADDGHYEAHWLVFDDAPLNAWTAYAAQTAAASAAVPRRAWLLPAPAAGLHTAFAAAQQALQNHTAVPDAVAGLRLCEVLLWLALDGGVFLPAANPVRTGARVQALLASRLDHPWLASDIASALAVSEPTLRRRLAAEGLALGEMLVEARMSFALTLLQATSRPIGEIAQNVGYASASRFAVRFRQRFGFAPSAIRGHERPG